MFAAPSRRRWAPWLARTQTAPWRRRPSARGHCLQRLGELARAELEGAVDVGARVDEREPIGPASTNCWTTAKCLSLSGPVAKTVRMSSSVMNPVAASKLMGIGSSAWTFQPVRAKRKSVCAAAADSSSAQASGTRRSAGPCRRRRRATYGISVCILPDMKVVKVRRVGNSNVVSIPREL